MKNIIEKTLVVCATIVFVIGISRFVVIPTLKIASIRSAIKEIQNIPGFEGSTVVVDAKYEGTKGSAISENIDVPIHPGSNYKLLTAAASLYYLTPSFNFKTNFYTFFDNGKESLVIEGHGDPTFHWEDIQAMAKEIQKANVHISGNIYYDDSYFTGEQYGPDWKQEWKDIHFGVPISALQIDDNILYIKGKGSSAKDNIFTDTAALQKNLSIIDARVLVNHEPPYAISATMANDNTVVLAGETSGDNTFETSTNIRNPSLTTAEVFKQELMALGIVKSQTKVLQLHVDQASAEMLNRKLVYEHVSAPLSEIVKSMLTFSKNNYGETLVRTIGEEKNRTPQTNGSQAKGVELLRKFLLEEVKIAPEDFVGRDGSGMSSASRITGRAIMQLFEYVNKQQWKDIFWVAFPTSNNEGTLRYRFLNAQMSDQVVAKTGTHDFASSLSGKIPRANDTILFSIHIFHHHIPSEEIGIAVHPVIDSIVKLLDERL